MTEYSEILKQNYTIDRKAGKLTTEDGQVYNGSELKILNGCSDELKRGTHKLKKCFNGSVVDISKQGEKIIWHRYTKIS